MIEGLKDEYMKFENSNCAEDSIFYQAMEEVIYSISPLLESDPKYKSHSILERLVVPDRIIKFKVTWLDDNQKIQVNTGYRVQFNNAHRQARLNMGDRV